MNSSFSSITSDSHSSVKKSRNTVTSSSLYSIGNFIAQNNTHQVKQNQSKAMPTTNMSTSSSIESIRSNRYHKKDICPRNDQQQKQPQNGKMPNNYNASKTSAKVNNGNLLQSSSSDDNEDESSPNFYKSEKNIAGNAPILKTQNFSNLMDFVIASSS